MTDEKPNHNKPPAARLPALALLLALAFQVNAGAHVILFLKNGDRVAGNIVSEDARSVVLTNSWIGRLPVPVSAIERRQDQPAGTAQTADVGSSGKNQSPAIVAATQKSSSRAKQTASKRWKANVKLGTDLAFGASDRQLYYSRVGLTYARPYESEPGRSFRTILDASVDFGKTDGKTSTDRMNGSAKADFDVSRPVFVYGLTTAGYDHVRKVDDRFALGPGAGYHVFTGPTIAANVESGVDYQCEQRKDNEDEASLSVRLAQDLSWKIAPRLTYSQTLAYFQRMDDPERFRTQLDTTLSLGLTQTLSFNVTLLDLYETNPAHDVDNNELQVRTALGVAF
jgi:putative salt-induced outer membrane protein YdiY